MQNCRLCLPSAVAAFHDRLHRPTHLRTVECVPDVSRLRLSTPISRATGAPMRRREFLAAAAALPVAGNALVRTLQAHDHAACGPTYATPQDAMASPRE